MNPTRLGALGYRKNVFMRLRKLVLTKKPAIAAMVALILGLAVSAAVPLLSPPADAASTIPYKINFQGRLTNAAGNTLADGLYNIKFRIMSAPSGGTNLFQEDYTRTGTDNRLQVTNGLFSVQLGSLTDLSTFDFTNISLYVEVELPTPATATCATNGCAVFTEGAFTPRQPLASSPYAFNADKLDGVDGASYARNNTANTYTSGDQSINRTSATAFEIQNASDAGNLFIADTSNTKIGIGAAPVTGAGSDILQVTGSINTSVALEVGSNTSLSTTALTIGGTSVCSSTGCTAAASSGSYIQNQNVGPQATANFNISGSGTIGTALTVSGGGQALTFNGATSNYINYGSIGFGAPTFTSRSVGTKLVLYNALAGASADYAIGIEASMLWNSVPTTAEFFKWYGGTTQAAVLSGSGNLTLGSGSGTLTSGAITVAGTSYLGGDVGTSGKSGLGSQAASLNVVPNASFEVKTNAAGVYPDGWTGSDVPGAGTAVTTRATDAQSDGGYAMKMALTGAGVSYSTLGMTSYMPVNPSKSYVNTIDSRHNTGDNCGGSLIARVIWYTAAGAQSPTEGYEDTPGAAGASTTTSWATYGGTVTSPSDAAFAQLFYYSFLPTGTCTRWLDKGVFRQASFSGDFQIQNTAGTSNLFMADATNTKIGIGGTPSGADILQVTGSASASVSLKVGANTSLSTTALTIGGVSVCTSSGCTASSTLQQAYAGSAGAAPSIAVNTSNKAFTIQNSVTTGIAAGSEYFGVRAAAANDTTIGNSIFTVNSGGIGINIGTTTPTTSADLTFGQGANRTINVVTQATAATAGNNLSINPGTGNTSGAGGQLNLTGGTGGNAGAGGAATLQGGTAGGGNTNGGAVNVTGGTASGSGTGGLATLQGGAAAAVAGSVGGAVTVAGANGTGTGTGAAGGNVLIKAGNAGGSNANAGGTITLQAGSSTSTGAIGGVKVQNVADSTTAFQVLKASGLSVVAVDTTNAIVEVAGDVYSKGIVWTSRTTPANNQWQSVAYGNGTFVAVSVDGAGNRIMTSSDGVNWTSRTSAADNAWQSVTYGNGTFVAVACGVGASSCNSSAGAGDRVMTSPDGITWTSRTSATDNQWQSVTYGNGMFVAVAWSGTSDRVMTSPDGITWTSRTSAADNQWRSVAYGNGLFVAVACGTGSSGSCLSSAGDRVMTSPDGISWTIRTSAADVNWQSVTYGNGVFVAVACGIASSSCNTTAGNRVMTSPDGITWTSQTSSTNQWNSVTYGNGLFVAVASSGTNNRVMTSPDGTTWTLRTTPADNAWKTLTYGNGVFVGVACGVNATSCNSTAGNRVMSSGKTELNMSQDILTSSAVNQTLMVGNTYFTETYLNNSNIKDVAIGDFNADGKMDLITAGTGAFVFINTGTALPTIATSTLTTGSSPCGVTTGDFNADGKTDAIVANSSSNTASVFINTGTALPTTATSTLTTGSSPCYIATGDFNADTKTDVIISNVSANTASVFINTGTALPTTATSTLTTGSSPRGVAVADFNADGKADAVIVNSNANTASVFINTGTALPTTATSTLTTGGSPYDITAADFNADGKTDAIVANSSSNTASVFINTGTALPTTATSALITGDGPRAVTTGDFNSDGSIDVLVADTSDHTILVYISTGRGLPIRASLTINTLNDSFPDRLVTADFNADGKTDFVTTNPNRSMVSVFTNQLDTLATPQLSVASDLNNVGIELKVGPGNRQDALQVVDGSGNYLAQISSDGSLSLNGGDRSNGFNQISSSTTGTTPRSITTGDFNGDANVDVIVVNSSANTASVFINTGTALPTTATSTLTTGTAPDNVAVADFNGDGKTDVIITNSSSNTASVFINTGTALPTTATSTLTTGSSPRGVAAADFNADGKADAVIANNSANTASVFINTGTALPTTATSTLTTGTAPDGIAAGDFNSDNNIDIIIGMQTGGSLFINTGTALPTTPTTLTTNLIAYRVAVGDINDDDKDDALLYGSSTTTVYINTATGLTSASRYKIYGAAGSLAGLAVGDFDANKKADAVIVGTTLTDALVFRNTGTALPPIPNSTVAVGNGNANRDVAAGDINGDGKDEFIVVSATSMKVFSQGPLARLSVTANTATAVGALIQGATSQTADLLQVKSSTGTLLANINATGDLMVNLAAVASTSAVCFTGGTNNVSGQKTLTDCSGAPAADYAENYPVAADTHYGDIVATGTTMVDTYGSTDGAVDWTKVIGPITQLVKSSSPYQANTIGIVSDNHGDFTSAGHNIKPVDNPMPVALNGRVPVNIASTSDPVQAGDYLTTSSDPGKAMKATAAGFVIGKALAAWDPLSGETSVMVFVEPGYYAGPSIANMIQNGSIANLAGLTVTGGLTVQGLAHVQDLLIDGHIITGGDAPEGEVLTALGTGATMTLDGNDTSGTIVIVTGSSNLTAGNLVKITFKKPFAKVPRVVLSGQDGPTLDAKIFPASKSLSDFMLKTDQLVTPNTTYTLDYIIIE